jgi:peptide/nickel transport system permease protein
MIALIIRRCFQSILVLLTVALLAFTMFRFVGDPVAQMMGQDTSLEDRAELREQLGLNDPIPIQFARYVSNIMQGNFGISFRIGRPVNELIVERLPATLELSLVAALFSLIVGIPVGVYTALYPERWLSKIFLTSSLMPWRLASTSAGV